jgi:hypothetical protein
VIGAGNHGRFSLRETTTEQYDQTIDAGNQISIADRSYLFLPLGIGKVLVPVSH